MIPKWPARLAALCTAIAVAMPASAQVQVNSSALQQLAGPKATQATPHHRRAPHAEARHGRAESQRHAPARPPEKAAHRPARHEPPPRRVERRAHVTPLPLPPPLPLQIRAQAAASRIPLPPPAPPAPRKPKPPPPRLTLDFLGQAASLGEVERAEIERFLHALPSKRHRFLIRARAPGKPGDPSVARRLALQRGLAVQSVLVAAGIPPERIIVQSLGDPPGADTRRVVLSQLP